MGGLGLGLQLQLQMSWQPSLLSQKRQTGPPLGLKNLGNSCYLNSVLQCLTYTPPLANFCLRFQHSSLCDSTNGERKRECPFCILEKRIVRSLSIDLTLDAPAKIQRCLRIFAEHFRCGRQEDAHEFLRYVIDACHNTCLRLKKLHCSKGNDSTNGNYSGSGSTVVKEIFGGALQSQVKCLSCNCESNKVDDIMDISLDILHSNSVRDAMQKFFQPEILAGNNKYKCEKCKKLVEARKQMSILQAPNILVIQLKRFEGIFGGKIDKAITFEEFLVLSSFMCKASQDPQPEYKLFGTIVHSGYSPESGHYYAYIKDAMGRWYCCNDSYVTLSTLQEVLSEKVYILFFCRANQKPVSGITTFTSNGVKSREFNENESSETPKRSVPVKSVLTKPYAEQPSREDISSLSKIDNVPSNPRVKFNILGNGSKRSVPVKSVLTKPYAEQPSREDISSLSKIDNVPSNPRVKFNILGNGSKRAASTVDRSADACKIQKQEANGSAKDSVHGDKIGKNTLSTRNSLDNNKEVGAVNGDRCQEFAAGSENGYNQNGTLHGVRPLSENNGSLCTMKTERPDHTERENYVNGHSKLPGCKRKLNRDSCILFAQDAQSEAKIEELKENLNKEALSVLRSCGWYEIVYRFMHSQKRLCAGECRNKPSGNTLKKSLIAEAKLKFIPQIPEALELDLLKHLQSFSTEK